METITINVVYTFDFALLGTASKVTNDTILTTALNTNTFRTSNEGDSMDWVSETDKQQQEAANCTGSLDEDIQMEDHFCLGQPHDGDPMHLDSNRFY